MLAKFVKKIEKDTTQPALIQTVRGVGYKFEPPRHRYVLQRSILSGFSRISLRLQRHADYSSAPWLRYFQASFSTLVQERLTFFGGPAQDPGDSFVGIGGVCALLTLMVDQLLKLWRKLGQEV